MTLGEAMRMAGQYHVWQRRLIGFRCLCTLGGDEFELAAELWRLRVGLSWADAGDILMRHGVPLVWTVNDLRHFPFDRLPVYSRS